MTRARLIGVVLGTTLAVGLLLFFLLRGSSARRIEYVDGTRAGDLDAYNVVGAGVGLRRGGSYMIALGGPKNVGHSPIFIESVTPQTTSPDVRTTVGHIWVMPKHFPHISPLPTAWPGWPPRNMPKSSMPARAVVSLPTSATLSPGREVDFVYGVFLHADPSPGIRVKSLRIVFKEDGRTFVWTFAQPISFHNYH